MTQERTAALRAFGRFSSSPKGLRVLTDSKNQGKLVMAVDESESWASIAAELAGRSCILAVHRGNNRIDVIEMIRTTKRGPNADDVHHEATAGMIVDVMNATGTDLRGVAVEATQLAIA